MEFPDHPVGIGASLVESLISWCKYPESVLSGVKRKGLGWDWSGVLPAYYSKANPSTTPDRMSLLLKHTQTHTNTLPLTPFNLVFNTYCRIRRPSFVWLCVSRPATWAVLHCQDYTGGAVEIELWHHRCKRSSLWPNSYRLVTWIRQDSDSAKPNTKDLQTEGLHHCTVLY